MMETEIKESLSQRSGASSISITRQTGIQMQRSQYKRQPRFGDILAGRPYETAKIDLPKTERKIEKLYLEYHELLPKLTYREAMALCRALRCSYSTHLMRRYGHRRPKLEEVILVVNWYKAGKPTTRNRHKLTIASLLLGK